MNDADEFTLDQPTQNLTKREEMTTFSMGERDDLGELAAEDPILGLEELDLGEELLFGGVQQENRYG